MNVIFLIISFLIILLIAISFSRDALSPSVIFCVPWIFASFSLLFTPFYYERSDASFTYLLLGACIFEFCYFVGHNKIVFGERFNSKPSVIIVPKINRIKVLIFFEVIAYCFVIVSTLRFIKNNFNVNYFLSYYSNRDDFEFGTLIGTIRDVVMGVGLAIIIGYYFIPDEEKTKYKPYLRAQVIIYLIMSILRMTRNGILFSLIPLFFCYLLLNRKSGKKVIKLLIIGAIVFLIYFVYFAMLKYWQDFQSGNFWDNANYQINLYLSGSLIAFQNFFSSKLNLSYGKNTFRFLLDIIDKLFLTHFDPGILQSFVQLSHNATVNVYTIYEYYANDFGWWYALLVQGLLGIFHGLTYKRAIQMRPYHIAIYSLSMYPLIMQFFQDQYLSIFGSWIKIIITLFMIFKTNLIFDTFTSFQRNI